MKYFKNENTPTIFTERLILRRFVREDAADAFLLYGDAEVNRFLPWFPHTSVAETERYLDKMIAEYERPIGYCYAIATKEQNRVIGYVTVHDIEREDGSADLGYALRKEYWNRGIVTEACAAVIDRLRHNGFVFLTATHDVNNVGSGRVMQKLGMRYRYSYEEQWQPKNITVTFRLYQLNFDGDESRVYRGYFGKYPKHFIEENI